MKKTERQNESENIGANNIDCVENMNGNIILYDWLTFSSKIHSMTDLIELLGLEKVQKWETLPGRYGYKTRITYENISIMYDGHSEDMGICVDMSGKGCRAFESIGNGDYNRIFEEILAEPDAMNISRLDVAYDDHTGILNLDKMCRDSEKECFVSKYKTCEINKKLIKGNFRKDSEFLNAATTIYHGSENSDIRIRIYDKAMERGYLNGEIHWVRCEIMLRQKRARAFIELQKDIGEKFSGVINNYVRYLKNNTEDTNKSRWETANYWKKLVGSAEKIRLYKKPGLEYNEHKLHNYVVGQAGNSINTYIEIFGEEYLLKQLEEQKKTAKLNIKQRTLINKHKEYLKELDAEKAKEAEAVKAADAQRLKNIELAYEQIRYMDFNTDTPIIDSYGNNWIKCDVCGAIKTTDEFVTYGGSGRVNKGCCRNCSINSYYRTKTDRQKTTNNEEL